MKIEIRNSFVKDADKLPAVFRQQLADVIELIEAANKLHDLPGCKKLKGHKTAFRIRLGQYRIGFYYERETIELVRILNRKDIYKYFP